MADPATVRATLEAMGERSVRRALDGGMMVWHLVQPAHAWIEELDQAREAKDATHERQQQGSDAVEHKD